jgi:hypothetical protein
MSSMIRAAAKALAPAGVAVALAGCAGDGENIFTTGALGTSAEAKLDPMCVTLASRIEALRKEGVAEKIEKAAAKGQGLAQGCKRSNCTTKLALATWERFSVL